MRSASRIYILYKAEPLPYIIYRWAPFIPVRSRWWTDRLVRYFLPLFNANRSDTEQSHAHQVIILVRIYATINQ